MCRQFVQKKLISKAALNGRTDRQFFKKNLQQIFKQSSGRYYQNSFYNTLGSITSSDKCVMMLPHLHLSLNVYFNKGDKTRQAEACPTPIRQGQKLPGVLLSCVIFSCLT